MLHANFSRQQMPLIETAWSTLDAAHDLQDWRAVECCRRVIDASLRGSSPARSDLKTIAGFFHN
jgi:hypothetical protein